MVSCDTATPVSIIKVEAAVDRVELEEARDWSIRIDDMLSRHDDRVRREGGIRRRRGSPAADQIDAVQVEQISAGVGIER
jgi:hypothetical protein